MMEINQLEDRACYESDKGKYGMIEVKTCMDGTEEMCCLSKGETGTQRTEIVNWRSHVSTVEVRIRSLNEKITLMPEEKEVEESYVYVEKAHIAPSKGSNINEHKLQVPARRDLGSASTNEIIQLSMTVDTKQAAEDSREGPVLHSKIHFK
ncbi:hypothetical protein [Halostagnicola sp. A-GB9-2]|uniref:hypothetical protein n=1 Tax=Halostagnicola sp. A-GB9-2 TaxID=3048066 RepID=UPI0024C0C505|nr:hypothetical protein [Halostagnicola sp. A-GB9-2]MDJ1433566.1 hypothetical protein [Halostagnicola sp. A-GB9-2]